MSSSTSLILGFEAESFDEVSATLQVMYLKYYLQDNTIEILQQSNNKAFLKRIYYPSVQLDDLYLGNSVSIYGRLYIIRKYANSLTSSYMTDRETHYLIDTTSISTFIRIITLAKKLELSLGSIRTMDTSENDNAINNRRPQSGSNNNNNNTKHILAQFVGVSYSKKRTYQEFFNRVYQMNGSEPITIVQSTHDKIQEIFHQAKHPIQIVSNSTLCILKPHIVKANQVGDVLEMITSNGYNIQAILSLHLTLAMAEELFDVYRSVIPNYLEMIQQICSGHIIALMVTKDSSEYSVVDEFRDLCGPLYPEIAKALRPKSIRAVYGNSPFQNAVHCTDLSDDGEMECRYIFETVGSL